MGITGGILSLTAFSLQRSMGAPGWTSSSLVVLGQAMWILAPAWPPLLGRVRRQATFAWIGVFSRGPFLLMALASVTPVMGGLPGAGVGDWWILFAAFLVSVNLDAVYTPHRNAMIRANYPLTSRGRIYGLVTRLRALGVPGMTRQAGNLVSSVYGVTVMGLALWAGWRARTRPVDGEAHRTADAATWLGLLNLASFRSPFVPDAYAYVGSLWLGTVLVGARRRVTAALLGATVVGWWALSRVFDGVTRTSTPAWLALLVMAIQGLALALSGWAVLQPITSRQSR
jgi:hypothetical protein